MCTTYEVTNEKSAGHTIQEQNDIGTKEKKSQQPELSKQKKYLYCPLVFSLELVSRPKEKKPFEDFKLSKDACAAFSRRELIRKKLL